MPVWTDGTVVRLRHGELAAGSVTGGINQHRLIAAKARHEHLPTVRCNGESMWCRTNLDAADDAVAGRVDNAHGGSAVTTDIDLAAVWRYGQAVGARRHRNGVQHAVGGGIEHADGLVFEESNIGLAYGRGRRFIRRAGRGWWCCQGRHHQQHEERERIAYQGETPSAPR